MSKRMVLFVAVACLCVAIGQAARADEETSTKFAVIADAVSIDSSASAYEAHLRPLLHAPAEYSGVSRFNSVQAWLRSLTAIAPGGPPAGSAPLPTHDRGDVDWAKVYAKVAPGVVFLAGDNGSGTGFLVDSQQGWVVTNHHVARLASLDAERHWELNAYLGVLGEDGVMEPSETPMRAVVYRWSPSLDLALLKLERPPSRGSESIELAATSPTQLPKSGQQVALVGHGSLGLLWAMKPGHISSVGTLSRNLPHVMNWWNRVHSLDPAAATQPSVMQRIQDEVSRSFQDWIGGETLLIQATSQASPGDSGGPLVNEKGQAVGMAMGLRIDQNAATSVSYYIHVNEIQEFVREAPALPLLEVTSSFWESMAVAYSLGDVTKDGRIDVLQGLDQSHNAMMLAVDLDQDTDLQKTFADTPVRAPVVGLFPLGGGHLTVYESGILLASDSGQATWQQRQPGQVLAAAASADQAWGAVGYADGSVCLFRTSDGAPAWRKRIDGTPVLSMDFGGSSRSLWLGTAAGTVAEISLEGGPLRQIPLQAAVVAVAASPNGEQVAVAEAKGPIRVFEAKNGRELWTQADVPAYALRFSEDSHHLVASPQADSNHLFWMNSWSGDVARQVELPGSPFSFELSADGSEAAVLLHAEGRYAVVDVQSGQVAAQWNMAASQHGDILERLMQGEAPNRPIENFVWAAGRLKTGDAMGRIYVVDLQSPDQAEGTFQHVQAPDMDGLVASKAFDAEFAWVLDPRANSCYAMYDLDNDARFDLILVDDAADLVLDGEYRLEGENLVRRAADPGGNVFLDPSQLPAPWRANYVASMGGS